MKRMKRTELIIETDELFVLSGDGNGTSHVASRRGCERCGAQAEMLSPESVAHVYSIGVREVFRLVEADLVHFEETPEGALLVCLPSFTAESAPEVDSAVEEFDAEGNGEGGVARRKEVSVMPKKGADAKGQRRTEVKKLSKPAQKLGKGEMKKIKGGDWLMSPAGNVRPKST